MTNADRYCYTLPNGECVSTDPRCMHQPAPRTVKFQARQFDWVTCRSRLAGKGICGALNLIGEAQCTRCGSAK